MLCMRGVVYHDLTIPFPVTIHFHKDVEQADQRVIGK